MKRITFGTSILILLTAAAFSGTFAQQQTGEFISLEEAVKLTHNFQSSAEASAPIGGVFKKETVLAILNQPNCAGLRYYYGRKDDGTPVLVLVGIDEKGNDLYNGILAEFSTPCPPFCDQNSPLIKK